VDRLLIRLSAAIFIPSGWHSALWKLWFLTLMRMKRERERGFVAIPSVPRVLGLVNKLSCELASNDSPPKNSNVLEISHNYLPKAITNKTLDCVHR
jgi:hypothetical protein